MMNTMLQEVDIAIRAKVGLIWIRSTEEQRVERNLIPLADSLNYDLSTWTATRGTARLKDEGSINSQTRDLRTALNNLLEDSGRMILVCYDASTWLQDPLALRTAKDAHRALPTIQKDRAKQIIFVDPEPPPSSIVGVTQIEWDLPTREDMAKIVDECLEWAPEKAKKDISKNGTKNQVVGAMLGLTAADAANALARSLTAQETFDAAIISNEKKQIVKGSGLEWYDPDPRGLDGVGGLDVLKEWLTKRADCFSKDAREYGLPAPKGVILLGVPGCGKSLAAKCLAAAWKKPLLRMDAGALASKFIGESNENMRKALSTAEAIGECILWLDECEKMFAGAQSSGDTDGGNAAQVFGTFLTWMQERPPGIFIIATSNDISKLPAEFGRSGRWDRTWFVDLPNAVERHSISEVMKKKYAACTDVDSRAIAAASDSYTGAEIEQAFVDSLYVGFSSAQRAVTTEDVKRCIDDLVPLSTTMQEKIEKLRTWVREGRAKSASQKSGTQKKKGREIE